MTNVSEASGRDRSDDLARLEPDPQEHLVLGEERARAAVDVDRERVVFRRGVALVEVVDEFLDPDARRIGQVAVADVAPGDGVGGGVDVEAERRSRCPRWDRRTG